MEFPMKAGNYLALAGLMLFAGALQGEEKPAAAKSDTAYRLIIMDPLSKPLSCPCVEGYAQRDYEQLAKLLRQELGRDVKIAFNESLKVALTRDTDGRADIVIGKHSVVLADARRAGLQLSPRLALAGKDGQTMMTGLFVVPSTDPATKLADLANYRIIFGGEESDEKYAAAMTALKASKVALPAGKVETCQACSDGAVKILELGPDVRAATVISSYAAPLLEGCGTIKKGDLRMIGTTAPVPFIEAFVSESLSPPEQAAIEAALLKVANQPELLKALETKHGFVQIAAQKKSP
jgi:ABC-type phosphate/phosphonate transport system substrate-binding protein